MTSGNIDWADAFAAIEAAMISAANQKSAKIAESEAERHGLTNKRDGKYEVWERTGDGVILHFRWHYYDQSHAYRTYPDMNVMSLELRQGDKIIQQVEYRFED